MAYAKIPLSLYKIHVVQIWVGFFRPDWLNRVVDTNKEYANLHGYTYELLHNNASQKVDTHIKKIDLFTQRLKHATDTDVFLYMDTDAMVWNTSIGLDTFPYNLYDFIISGHYHGIDEKGRTITPKTSTGAPAGINSGVWIVRGTTWAKKLFRMWASARNTGCCERVPGDQVLLFHIINRKFVKDFELHALYVNAARLNMDDSLVRLGKAKRPSAQFIIHLWGGLKSHIFEVLREIKLGKKPSLLA